MFSIYLFIAQKMDQHIYKLLFEIYVLNKMLKFCNYFVLLLTYSNVS